VAPRAGGVAGDAGGCRRARSRVVATDRGRAVGQVGCWPGTSRRVGGAQVVDEGSDQDGLADGVGAVVMSAWVAGSVLLRE